jgi:uncharacterized protein with FMN-binding domain
VRRVALAVLTTVTGLVMLLSFKTRPITPTDPAATVTPGAATSGSPSDSGSAADAGAGSGGTQTVTGDEAQTRYGPVQVQITITDGRLTEVEPVEYPQDTPRDKQINAFAIPRLDREALAAGDAQIDMVSGATYTSEGYITSLQSALDKAGLG